MGNGHTGEGGGGQEWAWGGVRESRGCWEAELVDRAWGAEET